MSALTEGTAAVGGGDWEPPPYTGHVIDMVDRLRSAGIEPSMVLLPCAPPRDEPMFRTFYGLPVGWQTGSDRVQLVVDVAVLVDAADADGGVS